MGHNRKIIYLIGFLFSIPVALTSYINSTYLANYIPEKVVGVIYIIASVITILSLLGMHKVLTRWGNRKTALYSSLVLLVSFILLAVGQGPAIVVPAFIVNFLAINFIIASLDIFVEDFSAKTSIGKFRGLYLTISQLAWVVAQMISGSVFNKSSFLGMYLLSALFMILVSLTFLHYPKIRDFIDPKYKKIPVLKNMEFFLENKNVSRIYFINLILKFFFAWMIIYTPIYLNQYIGFGWSQIGVIFTIMLLPFVILDFPLGKLSDKIGEKKMLIGGFLIAGIFTLVIPLVTSTQVWLWALLLFATRIGAATIEVMSESYFFKSVREEDVEETNFFRNTGPLSFILAPLVATPLLLLLPAFQYLFYILGAILLFGFWISLRLRDVR